MGSSSNNNRSCVKTLVQLLFFLLLPAAAIFFLYFFIPQQNSTSISQSLSSVADLPENLSATSSAQPPVSSEVAEAPAIPPATPELIHIMSSGYHREKVEEDLARARAAIRSAAALWRRNISAIFPGNWTPLPRIYRNLGAFYQSYKEMERRFKIYIYEEGEAPLVHDGPCKNIYTTEGRFIQELEMMKDSGRFRTSDPGKAHIFFLPFSVAMIVEYVYAPFSYDHAPIKRFVYDYIDLVASRYPFWNRSAGADHFMLSCHDWGPHASRAHPDLYNNSIRALCNANTSEGFDPRKDVSIPEIHLLTGEVPAPLLPSLSAPNDNNDLLRRPFLAFFAGGLHGPIRPTLLQHWHNRDPELQIYEYLPNREDYNSYLLRSIFCLCPSGYEVASPRIVESVYAGCIPVLISEGYVPPFADILQWSEFSLSLPVSDIPKLKDVLKAVSPDEIRRLGEGVRAVRRHFELNQPPKRFDVFHMILHSIWLRRLNVKLG